MTFPLPSPIEFDLTVREQQTLERAYRVAAIGPGVNRAMTLALFSALLQTISPAERLYRLHGNDPASWVLLSLDFLLLGVSATTIFLLANRTPIFRKPQAATVVTFQDFGLSVVRTRGGARTTRMLPFAQIRSVWTLPQAIVIASHWQRLLVIPKAALPDAGAALLSFLADRLTGKRMLVRSSLSSAKTVHRASTGSRT